MTFDTSRHLPLRPDWLSSRVEPALDPKTPIIDAHHHLWDRPDLGYLAPHLLDDIALGHAVRATVFVEAHSRYRQQGPDIERPLGEIAFAAKTAEAAAAAPGSPALCAAIVGTLNLSAGDRIGPAMDQALELGAGRLRGLRCPSVHHPDPSARGSMLDFPPGVLGSDDFRKGFHHLARAGLSFDAWMYHTQLDDCVALARAFPDVPIVLNHVGGPIGIGPYANRRQEVFQAWRAALGRVAGEPNVHVKISGLGMRLFGFDLHAGPRAPDSETVAEVWRPYVETAIELFGPERAMFASNAPVDKGSCSYGVLWNAFKRIAAPLTTSERNALFHDSAARFYRIS